MSKGKKVEVKEEVKTKAKGIEALLTSDQLGDVLAGVIKVMGDAELLRSNLAKQTVSNKCSKAGLKLRKKSNDEILGDSKLKETAQFCVKNFPAIKECISSSSVDVKRDKDGVITNGTEVEGLAIQTFENDKWSTEMQDAYEYLLTFGHKAKSDKIPATISFDFGS